MAINDNQGDLGHLMRGAIRWQSGGTQRGWPSRGHQEEAVRCNQMQSDAIRCDQMQSDALRCNPMHSDALTFPRRLWMDGRRLRQRRRRVDLHTHHHLAKVGPFGHDAPTSQSEAIRGNQMQLDAIRGNQMHSPSDTMPHRVRLVGLRTKRCCCAPDEGGHQG